MVLSELRKKCLSPFLFQETQLPALNRILKEVKMLLSELRQAPHLSASSIGDFIDCGLLYKFGRIDRIPMEFISDALVYGSTIHRVLESYYQAKMIGDRMPLKDIHELFENLWPDAAEGREDIKYAKEGTSFWVCGDDWQSIYAFTGASIATILNFKKMFPDSQQLILNISYRSTPQILRACQNLIKHNQKKIEKELKTDNEDGEAVTVRRIST